MKRLLLIPLVLFVLSCEDKHEEDTYFNYQFIKSYTINESGHCSQPRGFFWNLRFGIENNTNNYIDSISINLTYSYTDTTNVVKVDTVNNTIVAGYWSFYLPPKTNIVYDIMHVNYKSIENECGEYCCYCCTDEDTGLTYSEYLNSLEFINIEVTQFEPHYHQFDN